MSPGRVPNDPHPSRAVSTLSLAWGLLTCALLLLATGCETLDARLTRNQALLGTLPPERQELIRQGRIKIGFTPAEVYLAWGAPSRKAFTENSRGSLETWYYTATQTETYSIEDPYYDWEFGVWRRFERPISRYREYLFQEAVFTNGALSSYTVYPSYQPFSEPPPRY